MDEPATNGVELWSRRVMESLIVAIVEGTLVKPITCQFFSEQDASFQDRLRRLFKGAFAASDIAEPLLCFDGDKAASEALNIMQDRRCAVAGVLDRGVFVGTIRTGQQAGGSCREIARAATPDCILGHSASYQNVIEVLDQSEICLIAFLGQVAGVIQKKDMKKPPVRMWLFGLITISEMILSCGLERFYPNDSWQSELPEGRLNKARALLAERRRIGQDLKLHDCLCLIDKASILTKNPALREELGFESRSEAKLAITKLESLRNSLAHTHDIVTYDWKAIVGLAQRLDRMLSRF